GQFLLLQSVVCAAQKLSQLRWIGLRRRRNRLCLDERVLPLNQNRYELRPPPGRKRSAPAPQRLMVLSAVRASQRNENPAQTSIAGAWHGRSLVPGNRGASLLICFGLRYFRDRRRCHLRESYFP